MKIKMKWPAALLLLVSPMVMAQTLPTTPIYTYSAVGGYATNGNLTNFTDSVTGTWAMQYDGLSRLQSAAASTGTYQGLTLGWDYDSFGNRLDQTPSGSSSAPVPVAVSATYNANNQVQTSSIPGMGPGSYDAAGNVVFDGINRMAYDAENRVCAAYNTISGTITQYIYDADGNRVAKVNATSLNGNALTCAVGAAGAVEATYLLGQSGEQVTELDGAGNWKHTNVYANGQLLATYDQEGSQQLLHFNIGDPLGSKRVQASAGGVVELTCLSLPYGDGLNCAGSAQDATEHHFTGKERDTESGLDYFGARYYASSMGRWMSPDWSAKEDPVPYAKLDDPQTLNLYGYVGNNPLSHVDSDGHCIEDGCVVEGMVAAGAFVAFTASAYFAMPSTQRSMNAAASSAASKISSAFHSVFSKSSSSAPAASDDKPSTLAPGPHAGEGVPARSGDRNFTPGERDAVNTEGAETGCHTCGTKDPGTKSGNFVPDHQPPTSLNPEGGKQRLYPHCLSCSQTQGGEANAAKRRIPPPLSPPKQPQQQ